jgi:mannitol-1-phosphate 5-dehydrogenase
MPKIVHFGAGNIGRSLVGQLFSAAGWEVVFVDAWQPVIDALNARREYKVVIKDNLPPGTPSEIMVTNVRGLPAVETEKIAREIASADMIGTAVGANILPKILPTVAEGLKLRSAPISILFCENLRGADSIARAELTKLLPSDFDLETNVGLVSTSIGKMVPIMPDEVRARDPLEVWAEAYNKIVADGEAFIGVPPKVKGLVLEKNFRAHVDRKLFIHNFGHAVAAYRGALAKKTFIWECMADAAIRAETEAAMRETGNALIKRYPADFNEDNQNEHITDLLNRFGNRALGDTVFRVGRDLFRKLSPDDRCVGSLRLLQEQGGKSENVCKALGAALHFKATDESGKMFPDDARFQELLEKDGAESMLVGHCGLNPANDRKEIDAIVAEYEKLK